jgi:hypothetical protein
VIPITGSPYFVAYKSIYDIQRLSLSLAPRRSIIIRIYTVELLKINLPKGAREREPLE